MSSRRYLNMAHPNLRTWNTSQQSMPTVSHGQKMNHVPSPLGQAAYRSGKPPLRTTPVKEYRGQHTMQRQMYRLCQESQEHQEWQFLQNQSTMLQKTQETEAQRRDWFVHGNRTFTLEECLLACALKSFCRPLDPHEGVNDDTISEIIQCQRGWRDPDGIDCEGLYAALIHSRSDIRGRIASILRSYRHKWERIAWRAYWGWMITMGELSARCVTFL